MKILLSVVIPCYNEEANLKRKVLKGVKDYISKKDFNWEVIISDDGSTDGSRQIVEKQIRNWTNFRMLKNNHAGKPSALWHGIKMAKGQYVLFADMDQSTPIDQLERFLPNLKDYKVIIGSRGRARVNFPFYRKLGSAVFMTFRRAFILSNIQDTQCGFKLFDRNILLKAFPRLEFFKRSKEISGWKVTSFDVELLHIIEKMGNRIKEVPVKWHDADISKSKGGGLSRYFKESKEMLTQIMRVKFNDLRGLYDF